MHASLANEQFELAYRHAASVGPAGTLPPFQPQAVWLMFDLVEAAVRSGHSAEAADHVRAAEKSGLAAHSPRLALLIAAAGTLTDPENWRERFRKSHATPESERWVFDRARVHLVYGEQLRRVRALGGARTELTSAITGFRRLRASPWLERASPELRAAGGAEPEPAVLTPQEAVVADLAATGLSNKQIATQLSCLRGPSRPTCPTRTPSSASPPAQPCGMRSTPEETTCDIDLRHSTDYRRRTPPSVARAHPRARESA
jgi:hypothetical protein